MQALEVEKAKRIGGIPDQRLSQILEKSGGSCEWETVKGTSKSMTVLSLKGHTITAENNTLALIDLLSLIPEKAP
jgi:hypothetical protein